MKYLLLMTVSLISLSQLQGAETVAINEKVLWDNIVSGTPNTKAIEASFQQIQLRDSQFEENFNSKFKLDGFYAETRERQLNQFVPVTSPIHQYSFGVERNTKMGIQASAKVYTQQTTNNFLTKATTTGISAALAFDLYKNIGGRITRAQEKNLELGKKLSEYDKKMKTKAFFSNIRKIYWGLVANNESMKLTKSLIKHSQTQVKEAVRRLKSRVADEGEVAQYRSQLAGREAQLYYLQYQRESMLQQLKELLPDLAEKDIVLGDYSIDKTVSEVLTCTVLVNSHKETPLKYTFLDDVVSLLKGQLEQEQRINETYDDIDLKLRTQFDSIGKDFSFSEGFNNLAESGRPAFNVGLQLTIPLGSSVKDSAALKKKLDKNRYLQQVDSSVGKMNAYHSQLVKSINLLRKVVANQQANTSHLETSLKVSQKKYNQARITVQQFVQEQDMYLQSSLNEIEVKTQVINTLLDYFSIFTETPCNFNEF